MTLALALLVFLLSVYALNTWMNVGRFRRLKAGGNVDRMAFYKSGLAKSLILFLGGAGVSLILLHRMDALWQIPPEFGAEEVRSVLARVSPGLVYGVVSAWVAVVCLASLMGGWQMKRLIAAGYELPQGALGALLPRSGAERFWAFLISLNAGLSEELFFRVALPLLLAAITGDGGLAFALAVVIFGLGHAYQGIWGIVTTTIIGALLGFVYLYSGNIWLAVVIHAGIDLWSLVIMPVLIRWKP